MAEGAAVELSGLTPQVSDELLTLYFENHRRSGGGPVQGWQRLGSGGVLTFQESAGEGLRPGEQVERRRQVKGRAGCEARGGWGAPGGCPSVPSRFSWSFLSFPRCNQGPGPGALSVWCAVEPAACTPMVPFPPPTPRPAPWHHAPMPGAVHAGSAEGIRAPWAMLSVPGSRQSLP